MNWHYILDAREPLSFNVDFVWAPCITDVNTEFLSQLRCDLPVKTLPDLPLLDLPEVSLHPPYFPSTELSQELAPFRVVWLFWLYVWRMPWVVIIWRFAALYLIPTLPFPMLTSAPVKKTTNSNLDVAKSEINWLYLPETPRAWILWSNPL